MSDQEHTITTEMIKNLDELYAENYQWDILVSELRAIRRLVEAGTVVKIEGTQTSLTTWQEFYDWAHGRYHALEDGSDRWIGNDK